VAALQAIVVKQALRIAELEAELAAAAPPATKPAAKPRGKRTK
jgi:hypothetical protein